MADNGEKTHQPTARRIEQARAKGQVARTRELAPALSFLAVATVASWVTAAQIAGPFQGLERHLLDAGRRQLDLAVFSDLWTEQVLLWAPIALALLGAAAAGSVASVALQGGPHPAGEAFQLDLGRLSPMSRLKNLFSLQHGWDSLRGLFSAGVAVWIVYSALRDQLTALPELVLYHPSTLGSRLSELVIGITWRAGLGLVILAALDLFVNQKIYLYKLRMSREDIKQESRDQEGRPEVRAQRRRRQLELVRGGSIKAVRTADVVVTNPTHYAVALSYNRSAMSAPRVVAKGRDRTAERIRLEAIRYGVPLVENPPLARELYRKVSVDREIPGDLYRAVAEVLAFVLRLKAGVSPAGHGNGRGGAPDGRPSHEGIR